MPAWTWVGALAGPVVDAAVILVPNVTIDGLADSKLLTPNRREALFAVIVLATVSNFTSASGTDYAIPAWPGPTPVAKVWGEVTQRRDVDPAFVGREAIFAGEAKVYTYADIQS